ncbi:MAG TPA: hypothetical protein VJ816_11600 [Gemmatimonadales bacterium]|nr:hypothetical protein [Gemmatimonadales bacterium]
MNRRAWYLVGLVLLGAACQGPSRITEPYKPDPNAVALDSASTRANPHHKQEP